MGTFQLQDQGKDRSLQKEEQEGQQSCNATREIRLSIKLWSKIPIFKADLLGNLHQLTVQDTNIGIYKLTLNTQALP